MNCDRRGSHDAKSKADQTDRAPASAAVVLEVRRGAIEWVGRAQGASQFARSARRGAVSARLP
jgi:hypothetical protein